MKVDVSEIKTYRECKRKWLLTSRNRFHLTPVEQPRAFAFGTIFHEALGQFYLGVDYDKVMAMVKREMDPDKDVALLAMLKGYYEEIIPEDAMRFTVMDIEHHFDFVPKGRDNLPIDPELHVCGSIDMIVYDELENTIYGFEHKSTKNFREDAYLWMDEQPRVYSYALQQYVDNINLRNYINAEISNEAKPEPVKFGGVYLNEVRKLLRKFSSKRTLCVYPDDDLENFMDAFFRSCCMCKHSVETNDPAAPNPGWMSCNMCDYKNVCQTYMYSTLDENKVLKEFSTELKKRDCDHLEEKTERSNQS